MGKKFLWIIIVILLVFNLFMLVLVSQSRQNGNVNVPVSETLSDELHSYRVNLAENIANGNRHLNGLSVKDSSANVIALETLFNNNRKYLLISRFSDLHCESCVMFSIKAMMKRAGTLGKDNILFFGAHRNNRIFNKQKPHNSGINVPSTLCSGCTTTPAERKNGSLLMKTGNRRFGKLQIINYE
jgi:hypothetical protein